MKKKALKKTKTINLMCVCSDFGCFVKNESVLWMVTKNIIERYIFKL